MPPNYVRKDFLYSGLGPINESDDETLVRSLSKWMAAKHTSFDFEEFIIHAGMVDPFTFDPQQTEYAYEDARIIGKSMGGYKMVSIPVKDTVDKGDFMVYKDGMIHNVITSIQEPTPVDFDEFGAPIYDPKDLDDFGNILDVVRLEAYPATAEALNCTEKWYFDKKGRWIKEIHGIAMGQFYPDHSHFDRPYYVVPQRKLGKVKFKSGVVQRVYIKPYVEGPKPDSAFISRYREPFIQELMRLMRADKFEMHWLPQLLDGSVGIGKAMNMAEAAAQVGKSAPITWEQAHQLNGVEPTFTGMPISYEVMPSPIDFDDFGDPIYNPDDLDKDGLPIPVTVTEMHEYGYKDLAAIDFLEDWYLDKKTGALTKKVRGFVLQFEVLDSETGELVGFTEHPGRGVYFRITK